MKKITYLLTAFLILGISSCQCPKSSDQTTPNLIRTAIPERPAGQTDVIGLRCAPLDTVRVGFIGLGMRGPGAVYRFTQIEGTAIKALCDLYPERVEKAQEILTKNNRPQAAAYSGEEGWKQLCERPDIDLVYIVTPWLLHTPIAVYAMEHGKHVAIEVPAAMNLDEIGLPFSTGHTLELTEVWTCENLCANNASLVTELEPFASKVYRAKVVKL
mgnify:CR=1 FL=1